MKHGEGDLSPLSAQPIQPTLRGPVRQRAPGIALSLCPSPETKGSGAPLGATRLEWRLSSRRGALRRSTCGFFRCRATLSATPRRCHQPAPGGRILLPSRWSPDSPESGMPAGRRNRANRSGFPDPAAVSAGPHLRSRLRPAPPTERLMMAPLRRAG